MKRTILGVVIILMNFDALGCSCRTSFISSSFLGQMKTFDHVVLGIFLRSDYTGLSDRLVVEKVYKGNIKQDTIKLGNGGTDCFLLFDFKSGTQIMVGLVNSPYQGSKDRYFAAGCVTSTLVVTDKKQVIAPANLMPLFDRAKISLVRRKMNLKNLERKIKRKIK